MNENVFEPQLTAIENWIKEIGESVSTISAAIETVKEDFKDYKGDLTTLLKDIDKFQNSLLKFVEKLKT